MATITLTRADVREALYAESTNAARTMVRQDGRPLTNDYVIDSQADSSLDGVWLEATSKLAERMREFLTDDSTFSSDEVDYLFKEHLIVPDGVDINVKQYVVNYMMADWMASVRPDYRQRYIDRANFELDDLLRKLYKREEPI